MFFIILLLSAFNLSLSAPLAAPGADTQPLPVVLFGRDVPELLNVSHYRTKQDIIWSSLVTIFACTWVAVHPNIPGPWDSQWEKMKRKVVTMIYGLLAPEFMALWAMRQWVAAGDIARQFNEKHRGIVFEGNILEPISKHKFVSRDFLLAVIRAMEGFFKARQCHEGTPTWTRTHGFFVQMGGFTLCKGRTPVRVLELGELLKLVREKKVDVPDYTEEDINDKSKGDFLTKLIVVLQTTWFTFQCIARWASHLPVTELEVITLAFAVFNGIIYMLWWKKPQNVSATIRIPLKGDSEGGSGTSTITGVENSEIEELFKRSEKKCGIIQQLRDEMNKGWTNLLIKVPLLLVYSAIHPLAKLSGVVRLKYGSLRVPMFSADRDGHQRDFISLIVIGVLFGSIHLIPWSSPFLSVTELWLWRTSAIIITLEPLMLPLPALPSAILGHHHHWISRYLVLVAAIPSGVGALLYITARLTLLALAFMALRRLPPEAYVNIEWTSLVPHI